jgi:hypothetical protein
MYLRLEIHPFLQGRIAIGSAERLPFKRLMQMHAILDKVDREKEENLSKLEKQKNSIRKRF